MLETKSLPVYINSAYNNQIDNLDFPKMIIDIMESYNIENGEVEFKYTNINGVREIVGINIKIGKK